MSLVPSGLFEMGNNNDKHSAAGPIHTVYLDDFYIDVYEVTSAQFVVFLNEKGNQVEDGLSWLDKSGRNMYLYYLGGGQWEAVKGFENYPATNISWYGARAYCTWRGARLPTEAEWEKAARGGLEGKILPWGNDYPICQKGAQNGATDWECHGPRPVGEYQPNGYGLYDMVGNVFEWVADWYSVGYYGTLPPGVANPQGPETGYAHVRRGGSWKTYGYDLSVSYRFNGLYGEAEDGIRCAVSP
jgi:formylglycine-generating enzyme required for sulfatase activity